MDTRTFRITDSRELDTCIYPDNANYPLTEEQIHNGEPHNSNFSYAYTKRMLDVMSRSYRKQYGCNFVTVVANNLFGPNDQFDLENSHVLPAIIRKIFEAKYNNMEEVEFWGDGEALREFSYSKDFAKLLLLTLENYNGEYPLNVGNTEEYSIKNIVEMVCDIFDYKGKVNWNVSKPSGQFRKPSSNKKLLQLGWWKKEDYTPLLHALKETSEWLEKNYLRARGIR